jgi:hypothetical protein
MYIADVASLPWPHHPFKCPHKHKFEAAVPTADKDRWENWQPHVEAAIRSLPEDQIRLCPYHRPDWKLAAEAAITGWQECGSDDASVAAEFLSKIKLPDETGLAAWSFFADPIWINGPLLGNGQHRVCAMKLAGVPRCLVEE